MNAITERWVKTLRTELLNRTLIWNETHLRHALREYERHYNQHRTHRSLAAASPLRALPQALEPDQIEHLAIHHIDRTVSAGSFVSTNMPPDLRGRSFRHAHRSDGRIDEADFPVRSTREPLAIRVLRVTGHTTHNELPDEVLVYTTALDRLTEEDCPLTFAPPPDK